MPSLGTVVPYVLATFAVGIVLQWTRISRRPDALAQWRRILATFGMFMVRVTVSIVLAFVAFEFFGGALRAPWPFNAVDGVLGAFMILGTAFNALISVAIVRRFLSGHKLTPIVLARPRWAQRFSRQ